MRNRATQVTAMMIGLTCFAHVGKAADCEVNRIFEALATPLDGLKSIERAATDSDATEGGVWNIYPNAGGQVKNIVRVDIGENYNIETRLSIVDQSTWGISRTFTYYLNPYTSAPFAIRRADANYYFYCDGNAETIWNSSEEDNAQYAKDALELKAELLNAADIADIIQGTKIK